MAERVHLLLSAGRGPRECGWAVAQLRRRLEADAGRHGLTIHRVETVAGDRPGILRSALIRVHGAGATSFVGSWTGTLCWQAPSPYRSGTGRKNWYVIAEPCEVGVPHAPFAESDVDVVGCRTGGPRRPAPQQGQHRGPGHPPALGHRRRGRHRAAVQPEPPVGPGTPPRRLRERDRSSGRAAVTDRWHLHDDLVRGNPTRIERPPTS